MNFRVAATSSRPVCFLVFGFLLGIENSQVLDSLKIRVRNGDRVADRGRALIFARLQQRLRGVPAYKLSPEPLSGYRTPYLSVNRVIW